MEIKVYTDGACNNEGIGGWAYVLTCITDSGIQIFRAYYNAGPNMTNQKAELMAVLAALRNFIKPATVTILSDSAYIVNCFQQGWYKKWMRNGWKNSKGDIVANRHLWMQIIHLMDMHNVTYEKVKGHNGDQFNEYADHLAKTAVRIWQRKVKNGNLNRIFDPIYDINKLRRN